MKLCQYLWSRPPRPGEGGAWGGDGAASLGAAGLDAAALPDACITIAFTPGTEGQAKGVIITHAMLGAVVDGILGVLPALAHSAPPEPAAGEATKTNTKAPKTEKKRPPDVQLLTLPLAQTLGRVSLWVGLAGHHPTGLARSEATAFDDVRLVQPTFIFGVPSLFERAATAALREVRDGSGFVPFIGRWAHGAKRDEGTLDRIRRGLFDQMIRGAVRRRFGRGCTTLISSGAPLPEGVASLFARAGLPLREAYGMVETCAMTHLDSGAPPTLGTVGHALPGVEARLATDGELLLRGPSIMPGYWRDAAETRHVLDADGWFATGDLAHADDQHRLVITGRKRDIIVLSDGRSVAPRPIETALREDELIAQALVHGERRGYLTALIALDRAALERFAAAESLQGDFDALSRSARVHQHIEHAVARVNATLPPHANIKKFAVLATELSTEAGELTPTHTLRRSMAAEKFRPLLDSFYAESF
jgi:long-chain acyl-CoA synthetase